MKYTKLIFGVGVIAVLIGYSYITADFLSDYESLSNKQKYYGLSSLNIQTRNEVEKKILVLLSEKGCNSIDTIRTKAIEYKGKEGNSEHFTEGWIVSACDKKYAYAIKADYNKKDNTIDAVYIK